MTPKQKTYRSALIKAIHLSPKYRSYYKDNKEEYKEKLRSAFGVDSSTKLDIASLEKWVGWLNGRDDELPTYKPKMISNTQIYLMRSLWEQYANDKSDTALLHFSFKIIKKAFLHIEQINASDASKVITALKRTARSRDGR